MSSPDWQKLAELPTASIQVEQRLRLASDTAVASIVASILEVGSILQPLLVRRARNGYRLVDGLHRLEAARQLKLDSVPVRIATCSLNTAMRMEVDANLASAPLSPLDMAIFLAKHKELYEKEHPGSKATIGADLVAKRWNTADNLSTVSFAANAAEVFGKSERDIRRFVSVGSRLSDEEIDQLRKAPVKINFQDIQSLSKVSEPAERIAACRAVSAGSAKTVRDALRQNSGVKEKTISKREAQTDALTNAWSRSTIAAKRDFIQQHQDEIAALLDGISETAEIVPFSTARGDGA